MTDTTSQGELFGEGELKEYSIYEPQTLVLDDGVAVFPTTHRAPEHHGRRQHIPRYPACDGRSGWNRDGLEGKVHQTAGVQVGS